MAHTSGDQTKDGSQLSADSKDAPGQANPATTTATMTTASTATVHDAEQDKDFEPTAETLIDEIDDERTLEEEEAMASADSAAVQNEIDDLKRESEMPIEELLAYYQRMRDEEAANAAENEEEGEDEMEDDEDDDDEDEDEDESDEVRKRQSDKSVTDNHSTHSDGRTDNRLAQCPPAEQSIDRSTQHVKTMQLPQANHQLSNSHILQSPQQQHRSPDVSLSNNPQLVQKSSVANSGSQTQFQDSTQIELDHYTPTSIPPASGLFRTILDYDLDDSDDLDENYSYSDDESAEEEKWRRVIHVGPEYQAEVPEGLSDYETDLPPYENEDTLVWRCHPEQDQEQLLEYLKQASMIPNRSDISLSPASVPKISEQNLRLYRERFQDSGSLAKGLHPMDSNHESITTSENPPENLQDVYMSQSRKRFRIDCELEQENAMDGLIQQSGDVQIGNNTVNAARDDNSNSVSQDTRPELSTDDYFQGEEQLLYLLLQCNHNFEEALRRRRLDPHKYYISEPMSLWSQEECLGFEQGLRTYGKRFRPIREFQVPTRTRAEVVAFYYLWKKSERHDVYTNQYKLDKKRCLTHPGTTDYMDKFIEDNESALDASSTPTPTPTDSTVDVHQISNIENLAGNHPISIRSISDPETEQVECLSLTQELSISQGACNETDHQIRSDDNTTQNNSLHVDSNTPL